MAVYTYGLSEDEDAAWTEHEWMHKNAGEDSSYTSVSYEKAIKYGLIHENADGTWEYN